MDTLIINKRHDLPITKRLIWDGITVLLWVGWIYLWKPLLEVFYRIITLEAHPDEIADVIIREIGVIPFENAVFMLVTTPVVLFILSRLNRHQAPSEHLLYECGDYAEYFDLDVEELRSCVNDRLVTVYHDEHGRIVRLENTIPQKGD